MIHPEGNMNEWTKFHGKPFNIGWEISFKTTIVNLMVVLEENSEDQQSH